MAGPEREASVKLTLNGQQYLVELRKAGDTTVQESERARKAASAMGAGWKSAGSAIGALGSKIKEVGAMAGGLAAAFSVSSSVSKTIALREQFRDLEFQINKTGKASVTWQELHSKAADAALTHGQHVEELGAAMSKVFEDTGDADYTVASIQAIGAAAGASGKDVMGYANAAQMLQRKFGATAETIDDMMAVVVAKTGAGGANIEDLSAKFGLLAGEAVEAGFKGGDGLARLLDVMISLDARAGEKLIPGMKKLFQTLKDGSSSLKSLSKDSGVKFKDGEDSVEKLKKLMSSDKGRKALEAKLSGDVRVIYDELARPFETAMAKAKAGGADNKKAAEAGAKALDASLAQLGKTTLTANQMYEESIKGAKEDPRARLDAAVERMTEAFMQPEMLDAIDSLAAKLPELASALAKLVEFTVHHPLTAGLGAAGATMFGGFLKGASGALVSALVDQIKKSAIKSAVGKAIGDVLATPVTNATMGKGSGLSGMGKVLAVGAAGFAGYEAGKAISDMVLDPQNDTRNTLAGAQAAEGKNVSLEDKKRALAKARSALEDLKGGPGVTDMLFGGLATVGNKLGLLSDDDARVATMSHSKDVGNATERVANLERQIRELSEKPKPAAVVEQAKVPQKTTSRIENVDENARAIANYMKQQTLRVAVVGGSAPGGGNGSRGPIEPPAPTSGG